jgi:uncharacterized protein involved in cysteine biosynthesis
LPLLNPSIKSLSTGLAGYLRGARWMMARPRLLVLSLVPLLTGAIGFVVGVSLFFTYGHDWLTELLVQWFSGWEDGWVRQVAYGVAKVLMMVSLFMSFVLSAVVLTAIVAAPVHDYISLQVERELLGGEPFGDMNWSRWLQVMLGEVLKAIVVVMVPLIMFFIPGVNLFAGLVAAFLMGWDFYDFPLARRGWTFKQRFSFVVNEFWTVLGFGFWLAIPFVHVLLVPLAAAGGTILNLEALARRGIVTLRSPDSLRQSTVF